MNTELALAAREAKAYAERLPEERRPDVAEAWAELTDELEGTLSDGGKVLAIVQWRAQMRARRKAGAVR